VSGPWSPTRRALGALALSAALSSPVSARQNGPGLSTWERPDDFAQGARTARVVLIEYGSTMCPACAAFHADVLPEIIRRYVDTGRVRYIFRTFPTGSPELALYGGVLARCAGAGGFSGVIERLMQRQSWIVAQARAGADLAAAIQRVASDEYQVMSAAAMKTCVEDRAGVQRVIDIAREGESRFQISGTPSLIVNGMLIEAPGGHTVASVAAALDRALAAVAAPARRPPAR
jgi:protein-disulfide isomerase